MSAVQLNRSACLWDNRVTGSNNVDNVLRGGDGDDFIQGLSGDDVLYGGAGDDDLRGQTGIDTYFGENGNDFLLGGAGDLLYGGAGADSMRGYGGTGLFDGGSENDIVCWRDYQHTGSLGMVVDLDAGIATDGDSNEAAVIDIENITGSVYADTLKGDDGANVIRGGADRFGLTDGNDLIHGYCGDDMLYGNNGSDTIVGGSGLDFLYGGSDGGAGVFGFSADENSIDRVYNFDLANDVLNFTDMLTGYTPGTSDIDDFILLVHTGSRFDEHVDADGGADGFVSAARIYTDIDDNLTAADLLASGALEVDNSLIS
ncbi:MAG: calcium-binding protein [Hyphomicrobiales bacterium]